MLYVSPHREESRFPLSNPVDTWFAVYVKPRHEKSVEEKLRYKDYKTSVPLRKCYHTRACGTTWESDKPLIPRYVFVAHQENGAAPIVTTPGVIAVLGYREGASAISSNEIVAMERLAKSEFPVAHCSYIKIGDPVELVGGPLKGVRGKIVKDSGSTRLVVSIELLQRSMFVEIENTWAAAVHSYAY